MDQNPARPPICDVGEGNGEESGVGAVASAAATGGREGRQEPGETAEDERGDEVAVQADEESYGERKPKAARQPDVPTKAE